MKKPWLYSVFKLGRLPKKIDSSKLLIYDEGVKIVIHYKNFKSKKKNFKSKKTIMIGSIMCTKTKFIAFAYNKPLFNLAMSDERLRKVDFTESTDTLLCMNFDVSNFSSDSSGDVSYKFHTTLSMEIIKRLKL